MSTHACRPEEHWRFSARTAVEAGKPAARAAARNSVAPPPGGRTDPTAISWTSLGSIPERETTAERAPTRRSAAAVSLKPPLPPLVKGVRRAAVMTMSSGFLERMAARPVGVRWEATWPTRDWAGGVMTLVAGFEGWGRGGEGRGGRTNLKTW